MEKSGGSVKPSADPTPAAAELDLDLKSVIRADSLFFDQLVELIPARFYLPVPEDKPWFQGLSKAAKASAKRQSRENLKKARRARHDPDHPPNSTLDLLQNSLQPDDKPAADDEDSRAVTSTEQCSVTYEELRQRLHRRIEELRAGRGAKPGTDLVRAEDNDKKEKKKTKKSQREKATSGPQRKRKRDEETKEEKKSEKNKKKNPTDGGAHAAVPTPDADISFGQLKVGGDDGTRRKKKLSKVQALEKARKLEEAKKDPEKGEMVAKKHSWSAAASRAAGVKVHDDPKLLKESIKKDKRRQQQHAEKWNERVQSRNKAREDKQRVRSENIKERIHQRKMRRIEKREKKLMRPGFEGRKEGYINC